MLFSASEFTITSFFKISSRIRELSSIIWLTFCSTRDSISIVYC